MVGKNLLLPCLMFVAVLCTSGCAHTTSKFGWSDIAEHNHSWALNEMEILAPDVTLPREPASQVVTIGNERGGYVVDYAARVLKLQASNAEVRFTGHCDSACTLYLALPQDHTCIARGASFRFHAPTASTRQASSAAKTYMLRTYPEWVTTWLDARGGLSRRLITMEYGYASQYLRPCETSL